MKSIPSAKWFLACYVRDLHSRLDLLKAAATSVYGKILKIDSTKKITRKLQGVEAESANWVQFHSLFSSWPNREVRLDIFHFMRRLAAGCNGESHPSYGVFMAGLARCIFEWDVDDVSLLFRAKRGELQKAGVVNPSEDAVRKAVTKEEMARHCRRQTRGVEETCKLLDSLFSSTSTATDALGVPLFRDDMLTTVWPEQKKHLPCIQDPPGVQLYTVTGYVNKGGVRLPVLRCARGSTSLESFHLHLARLIPGKWIFI